MGDLAAIWRDSSLQLARLAAANDIDYFHFLQPNQYAGGKVFTEEELERAIHPNPVYRFGVRHGYPRLAAAGASLREQGVEFTDLTQIFADERETVWVDRCCHLNRRGQRALARAVARAIGDATARDAGSG